MIGHLIFLFEVQRTDWN